MERCKFIVVILGSLGHILEVTLLLAMKGNILPKYYSKHKVWAPIPVAYTNITLFLLTGTV